jgi:hypothetical protein
MTYDDPEKAWMRRRIAELEAEVVQLTQTANRATDLLVQGEQLRERMLLHAIVNGAYDKR